MEPSSPTHQTERRPLAARLIGGGLLLFGFGEFASRLGMPRSNGGTLSAPTALLAAIPGAALWTAAVCLSVWLTRTWPLGRSGGSRAALVHVGAAAAVAAADLGVTHLVNGTLRVPSEPVPTHLFTAFLIYFLLLGVVHAVEYARRHRRQELDALRLRAELTQAELERTRSELRALKMELNPHFLLNALNSVHALLPEDPSSAGRMLVHLGDLLRRSLAGARVQEVPLREEIESLRSFLLLERLRFGGALQVDWDLSEDALDEPVPHLVLQPLAAHAIGRLEAARGGGGIGISARLVQDALEVELRDTGSGTAAASDAADTGLSFVRQRLQQLYGEDASLHLEHAAGQGAARLRIPTP